MKTTGSLTGGLPVASGAGGQMEELPPKTPNPLEVDGGGVLP